MNGQFWWYVARASGIVAWLVLTATVLWGIVLSTKAFPERRRPAWLLDLHRWLGGLTVGFVAIHLVALVADSYVTFTLTDLAVPYASDWKPGAVALGIVAAWSLIVVEATSLAMRRLPRKVWRAIHLVSYLSFWLTTLHAAFAGTDRSQLLYQATAAVSIGFVAWAVVYRLTHRQGPRRSRPAPVPGRPEDTALRRIHDGQTDDGIKALRNAHAERSRIGPPRSAGAPARPPSTSISPDGTHMGQTVPSALRVLGEDREDLRPWPDPAGWDNMAT